MSAIALLLARMGHTVSGSDLKESVVARAARGRGRRRARRQPGRERAARRRRGRVLDRDPARGTSSCVAARRARDPGAAPLGRARRARRDPAHDRGRGLARQDHHVVDARADPAQRGLAAELRDRRRGQRGRHQRRVRRGRVARRRGRRERRHVPAARPRGRARHERRARPPRLLRRLRRARRRVRAVRRRGARAGRVLRRRRGRGAPRERPRPDVRTYGFDAGAHYRIVDVDARRGDVDRFTLVVDGERLGELVVPLGGEGRDQRGGRGRARARARRAVRRRSPRRCAASAASPAASSAGASATASRSSTTTRTSRARSRPRSRPRARARGGASIAVFQPHRYTRTASLWQRLRRRVRRRRRGRAHRRVPRGRDADPGRVGPAASCTRCSTRRPTLPVAYLPRPADLVDRPAPAGPPRRRRADARRRRPHDDARRVARRADGDDARARSRSTRSRATLAARLPGPGRARRAERVAHDVPLRRPARGASCAPSARTTSTRVAAAGRSAATSRCS